VLGPILAGTCNGEAGVLFRQLSDGDANTAYFHLIARGRKQRSYIPALLADGHITEDHSDMELALHKHFAGCGMPVHP